MDSFDRIKKHLDTHGASEPVRGELRDDLETLVRNCDDVRSLGKPFGSIELSPYMQSLLRISVAALFIIALAGCDAPPERCEMEIHSSPAFPDHYEITFSAYIKAESVKARERAAKMMRDKSSEAER